MRLAWPTIDAGKQRLNSILRRQPRRRKLHPDPVHGGPAGSPAGVASSNRRAVGNPPATAIAAQLQAHEKSVSATEPII
jgi:hypothetical protein